MGKPRDPAYWRKWRAAHPEYRERELERLRLRRAAGLLSKGDVAAQRVRRLRRRLIANGDNGETLTEHPLLAQARAIAARLRKPDHRTHYLDPLHEDAVGVAALALVEGKDATEAARDYLRTECLYRWYAACDVYDLEAISPLGVEEVPL